MVDACALDRIIKETIQAIEKSKFQIYDIAENSRSEFERVSNELAALKEEVKNIIITVDELEKKEKKARIRLMEVSKDFHRYTEKDIKEAYDKAYNLQTRLITLQEKEKLLRFRRNQLEISLQRLQSTSQRAEKLVSQVGVVLNFLSGNLHDLSSKIGELQQTQQMALSIIKAQEEERKRVAREIHDGPAQSMANVVMRTDFCLKLLDLEPSRIGEELQALQKLVRYSLQDIRKIIFDLRPMVLDDLGLAPAVKRYVTEMKEQYNLPVEFLSFGTERRLDNSIEVSLFRIIQEALSNIRKHARARQALVKMEFLTKKINIQIKDNGQGFDLKIINNSERKGYGLISMRERVQLLAGEMVISTAPGQGTSISISVPLTT